MPDAECAKMLHAADNDVASSSFAELFVVVAVNADIRLSDN